MAEIPGWMMVHEVGVETQGGEGAYGDDYATSVTVRGFLSYSRQLVRDQAGAEVVSEATFFTTLDQTSLFPSDSRVTLPDGSKTYVLKAKPQDSGGLGAPDHLEVTLA